jgi:hypothetical protein
VGGFDEIARRPICGSAIERKAGLPLVPIAPDRVQRS